MNDKPKVHALASYKNCDGDIPNAMAIDENLEVHTLASHQNNNEDMCDAMAIDENSHAHALAVFTMLQPHIFIPKYTRLHVDKKAPSTPACMLQKK